MYSQWPTFPGRTVYSENALNTWDAGKQKHVVFPLVDSLGAPVPNAYVVGIEEAANNDFQDLVYIIRNVAPVSAPTADFDIDGYVDGHDFLAWQRGLGVSNAQRSDGDTNADGDVDSADLMVWRQQFGQGGAVTVSAGDALSEASATFAAPNVSTLESLSGLPDLVYGAGNLLSGVRDDGSLTREDLAGAFSPTANGRATAVSSGYQVFTAPDSSAQSQAEEVDEFFAELGDEAGLAESALTSPFERCLN
jgi:hypothetical protein